MTLIATFQDRCEFQIGRSIVYIQFPNQQVKETCLIRGKALLEQLWAQKYEIIEEAVNCSRSELSEVWQAIDRQKFSFSPMLIRAVWVEGDNITLDICFSFELPETIESLLPEDYGIHLKWNNRR